MDGYNDDDHTSKHAGEERSRLFELLIRIFSLKSYNFPSDASKKSTIPTSNIPKASKFAAKSPPGHEMPAAHGARSSKQPESKFAQARENSPEKRGASILYSYFCLLITSFRQSAPRASYQLWEASHTRLGWRLNRLFLVSNILEFSCWFQSNGIGANQTLLQPILAIGYSWAILRSLNFNTFCFCSAKILQPYLTAMMTVMSGQANCSRNPIVLHHELMQMKNRVWARGTKKQPSWNIAFKIPAILTQKTMAA